MLAVGRRPPGATPRHSNSTSRHSIACLLPLSGSASATWPAHSVLTSARHGCATIAFAHKEDRHERRDELQAYIERERILLAELSAARSQVGQLLEQQAVLLSMVARLTGLAVPGSPPARSSGTAAPPALTWSPQPPPSPPPAAAFVAAALDGAAHRVATPSPPSPAAAPPSGARSPTASDLASPSSVAELLRSAAAAAPGPAAAAAAASVAAAIAAVDAGDILTTDIPLLPPPPRTPPAAAAARAPPASPTAAAPPGTPSPLPQPELLFDTFGGFTLTSAASPASPASSGATAAAAAGAGAGAGAGGGEAADGEEAPSFPVEVPKAAPTDPPPDLAVGDDDIFWLSRLHAELEGRGFYPGDDDVENWFYGDGTANAVMAFQASASLPETGTVDRATWIALLGAEAEALYARAPAPSAAPAAEPHTAPAAASGGQASQSQSESEEDEEAEEESAFAAGGAWAGDEEAAEADADAAAAAASGAPRTRWPVLREGDGGREVHALQVALANQGYHSDDDEMRWWQFGDATYTALRFFQSCSGLPETGVADGRTWAALLGPDATPADLRAQRLRPGLAAEGADSDAEDGQFEEDMDGITEGRVWLLGEERWEKRG